MSFQLAASHPFKTRSLLSQSLVMLILVIGDLHIPLRSHVIPAAFKESLTQNAGVGKIFCTGNLTSRAEIESLKEFCPDVQIVRGEFDEDDIPDVKQIVDSIAGFRIALVSAYTIIPPNDKDRLLAKARELSADILIFGGGHRAGVFEEGGTLFVNPGSATGAFCATTRSPLPSFILINVQGSTAVSFVYTLAEDGQINVTKEKFTKPGEE
jgi:putative phosphoesterase